MIDLKQLMEERSAVPPTMAGLRYPLIRKRIAHRNRRRLTRAAAVVAVFLAVAGGYAGLPRSGPAPVIGPPATQIGPFPEFAAGSRLAHAVTAPVAARTATLTWTPSTLDFEVTFQCSGVPSRVIPEGRLLLNGHPFGGGGCVGPIYFRLAQAASAAGFGVRIGEPMTVTYYLDRANAANDPQRPVSIPTDGIIAVGIYVPVPFTDYPLPSRPARLGPLATWANCPPEQRVTSDPQDPLKPLTLTAQWRDHILIRHQALTPGFLHIAVDGVRVTTQEWWEYGDRGGTIVWSTTLPDEWARIPGWKNPAQGAQAAITFTPEHFTGPWQVGLKHTDSTHCG